MALVQYNKSSLWYNTSQSSWFLSTLSDRGITRDGTDKLMSVSAKYNLRPDLLSYDLYGTVDYRWTFLFLNPDVIKDPIYDFITGIKIYTATADRLRSSLGG